MHSYIDYYCVRPMARVLAELFFQLFVLFFYYFFNNELSRMGTCYNTIGLQKVSYRFSGRDPSSAAYSRPHRLSCLRKPCNRDRKIVRFTFGQKTNIIV